MNNLLIYLFFIAISFPSLINTKVCSYSGTNLDQTDIDYIKSENCNIINSVVAVSSSVQSLKGLSDITIIGDTFSISTNELLTTVELEKLVIIEGSLIISDCILLSTISFPKLHTIQGELQLRNLPSLINIDFIQLSGVHDLIFEQNDALLNIGKFTNLKKIESLMISNTPIVDISGLSNLESISDSLLIKNNWELINITSNNLPTSDEEMKSEYLNLPDPSSLSQVFLVSSIQKFIIMNNFKYNSQKNLRNSLNLVIDKPFYINETLNTTTLTSITIIVSENEAHIISKDNIIISKTTELIIDGEFLTSNLVNQIENSGLLLQIFESEKDITGGFTNISFQNFKCDFEKNYKPKQILTKTGNQKFYLLITSKNCLLQNLNNSLEKSDNPIEVLGVVFTVIGVIVVFGVFILVALLLKHRYGKRKQIDEELDDERV